MERSRAAPRYEDGAAPDLFFFLSIRIISQPGSVTVVDSSMSTFFFTARASRDFHLPVPTLGGSSTE